MFSLPQSLMVRPVVLWVPNTELEDKDRKWNEAPIIQRKTISDLIIFEHDTQKSMGLDGIHQRVLKECTELLTETTSITSQESWLTQKVTVDLEVSKCHVHLQEGQGGRYREL